MLAFSLILAIFGWIFLSEGLGLEGLTRLGAYVIIIAFWLAIASVYTKLEEYDAKK